MTAHKQQFPFPDIQEGLRTPTSVNIAGFEMPFHQSSRPFRTSTRALRIAHP